MLLRSASSPILNSWILAGKDPSPDLAAGELTPHPHPQIPRSHSITHLVSPNPKTMITRTLSEGDLSNALSTPKRGRPRGSHGLPPIPLREDDDPRASLVRLLSSSGLDGSMVDDIDGCCKSDVSTLAVGDGSGGRGSKICGGRGSGDGSEMSTDAYYLKLIEANPGNSLVLGNYAKYLKEVRGDFARAEKYCERAILASPDDADVLSLYADLVWQTKKDAERAEIYFDQAVQAAPEDCYVMASYARFLWDSEEEEGGGVVKESSFEPPPLFHGSTTPSVAAAS